MVTIVDSASLSVGGRSHRRRHRPDRGNIAIPGAGSDGGLGSVVLIATAGTIDETGSLIAGTLSGSSTGATTLTGTANLVVTLGSFTAAGFSLADTRSLAITGPLTGGTSAAIINGTPVSITGYVSASAVSLHGSSITISGTVTDGGAGTVSLVSGGTIGETGTLIAGTLTGSSGGATSLTGATPATNQVAVLGEFPAAGFTLNDGESLVVSGIVSGGSGATIADLGSLTIGGTIGATAVSLTATGIAISGEVTDGGAGTVGMTATGGTINETGR